MLSLGEIREAVVGASGSLDCVYVLLFGSRAAGSAKGYSDVDVAVKFMNSNNSLDKALNLMSDVEALLGVHVDVIPLNIADTIVKYEAYSGGIILFCRDYDRYMDDFINAVDEYLDFEYVFNMFYEITVKEIRDACSGG
jgi:predicted nucleotidyltransferase